MNVEKALERFRKIVPFVLLSGLLLFVLISVASSPDLAQTITDALGQLLPDEKVQVCKNIQYLDSKENQQFICGDLYKPADSSAPLPVVVVIHGGSWNSGDKADVQESATSRWLAKHGYAAYNINYRLVGHGGEFPQDILDMKEAVAFLKSNHAKFKLDPNRIFMLGSSSGATGAMLAAYNAQYKDEANVPVKAIASFSGPTDLSLEIKNYYVKDYFSKPQDEKRLLELARQGSPLFNCKSAIPTIFIHGTEDKNVSIQHSIRLCKRLQAQGVKVVLVPVEGAGHFIGSASKNLALEKVLEFFKSVDSTSLSKRK